MFWNFEKKNWFLDLREERKVDSRKENNVNSVECKGQIKFFNSWKWKLEWKVLYLGSMLCNVAETCCVNYSLKETDSYIFNIVFGSVLHTPLWKWGVQRERQRFVKNFGRGAWGEEPNCFVENFGRSPSKRNQHNKFPALYITPYPKYKPFNWNFQFFELKTLTCS